MTYNLEALSADWVAAFVAIAAAFISLIFSLLSYRQSKEALKRADIAIQIEKDIAYLENYRSSILHIADYNSLFFDRYLDRATACLAEIDKRNPISKIRLTSRTDVAKMKSSLMLKNEGLCDLYNEIYLDFMRLKTLNNSFLVEFNNTMLVIWNSAVFTEDDIERYRQFSDIEDFFVNNVDRANEMLLDRFTDKLAKARLAYVQFERILSSKFNDRTSLIVQ